MKSSSRLNNSDYYPAMGIAVGASLGLIFGMMLESLAIATALGAAGGLIIGAAMRGMYGKGGRNPR